MSAHGRKGKGGRKGRRQQMMTIINSIAHRLRMRNGQIVRTPMVQFKATNKPGHWMKQPWKRIPAELLADSLKILELSPAQEECKTAMLRGAAKEAFISAGLLIANPPGSAEASAAPLVLNASAIAALAAQLRSKVRFQFRPRTPSLTTL